MTMSSDLQGRGRRPRLQRGTGEPAAVAGWAALILFLAVSLFPLWTSRFPPMQDYPQHLAATAILAGLHDPAFDYGRNLEGRLRIGPYSLFYLTTLALKPVVGIEASGKLFLSIYLILIAVLFVKACRRARSDPARLSPVVPAVPLLFFVFAFNQFYFLGMLNFLISVPLLVLALMDHERIANDGAGRHPVLRLAAWQLALFLAHPFTFGLYVLFSVLGTVVFDRSRAGFKRSLGLSFLAGLAFLVFFIPPLLSPASSPTAGFSPRWLPPRMTFAFFFYMFTGMRLFDGVNLVPVLLWAALAISVICGYFFAPKQGRSPSERYSFFWGISLLLFFVLPFAQGSYSYVNFRLAPISYFFLALTLSRLRLRKALNAALIVPLAALVAMSVVQQKKISGEIEAVVPIVERIPPNSRILPLIFDNDSPNLDRPFFDAHLHDHQYYHILVGGGFNPYLLSFSIGPIRIKTGAAGPVLSSYEAGRFDWNIHSDDYRFFLTRGAPPAFLGYLGERANPIVRSGPWILFERK